MDLTDEQREAVKWQWWIVAGTVALLLLALLGSLVAFNAPSPGGTLVPAVCLLGGLSNLSIGYLSVRYKASILGRRIDFWRPIEGGSAVVHGYISMFGGILLLVIMIYFLILSLPEGQGLWYVLGGLFVLVMLAMVAMGLRRAFKEE